MCHTRSATGAARSAGTALDGVRPAAGYSAHGRLLRLGGYGALFGKRFSRHLAKRYRRAGWTARRRACVDFLTAEGVEGASVLEIGGGVGAIQLELLRRGASRATNLELVDSYDGDAHALAAEAGVTDRMTRRQLDLATSPDAVGSHDIVVLHRVVCCYPDYERLLGAAAAHANRLLVYSHPPRNGRAVSSSPART